MEKETDIQNVNDQKSSLKVILRYTLTEALFFLIGEHCVLTIIEGMKGAF